MTFERSVLAAGTLRGWRAAISGTAAGLAVLAVIVIVFGSLLSLVPLHALQLVIGVLLLLFGSRWLRKAVLRAAGIIPLRDESAMFAAEMATATAANTPRRGRFDWFGAIMAFKPVLLEGLEVVFIVIAVGASGGLGLPASLGALAACVVVLAIDAIAHRPLAHVPVNTFKFAVGVMLCAFGVFWTGEGLGIVWPGADLMLPLLGVAYLVAGLTAVKLLRQRVGATT